MISTLIRLAAYFVLIGALALLLFRGAALIRESSDVARPESGSLISTPSGAIHVQSDGPETGTPLLLAHGSAAWSGFWSDEIELLGDAGFRAHAFDMPPFGFSERARDGDYSRTAQATRIIELVEAMDMRPILIAHSFGGAAAAEAVLMKPDAFRGLILIDAAIGMLPSPPETPLPAPLRPKAFREAAVSLTVTNPLVTGLLLRGLLHNKEAATRTELNVLRYPLGRPGTTSAVAEWLPSLLSPRTDTLSRNPDSFRDLNLPVEIIWGDKDTVTPPSQAEALAIALGQGPVTYLPNTGHIPHIETPEAFAEALLTAIKRIIE
ncbi:MAG: alpha/beta fold hydrolase [Arenibacterium sp.]